MSHESDEVTSEEQNTNGNNGNRVTSPSSKAISESINLNGTNSGRHSILPVFYGVTKSCMGLKKNGKKSWSYETKAKNE